MFRRILLWFAGILIFSTFAFWATSIYLMRRAPKRGELLSRLATFELTEGIRAYQAGGSPALKIYLDRVDQQFNAQHYITDRNGRDLVTGEDRGNLIGSVHRGLPIPFFPPRQMIFRRISPDSNYQLIVKTTPNNEAASNLPVYLWIIAVIVVLCYLLAWTLAKPVRALRETVVNFGRGQLGVRVNSSRKDEIGELSRAFDQMAGRIETLLTAERRLLQDISHELRSPLARMRFALELAKSSSDPKVALDRVNKEVARLSTLIGELLQVTRAEGDPESRNIVKIDLNEFLGSIVNDCQLEAEARGSSIDFNARDRLIWPGDQELLHRAFENILRNAIHHSPKGQPVEVDLLGNNGHAIVRVRDYGPGVPEDSLSQIFRPFYRVEEDRNRNNGGVGLGLAIAQRAVRAHHGEIQAQNMNPGLAVEMRLPR